MRIFNEPPFDYECVMLVLFNFYFSLLQELLDADSSFFFF